MSKQNNEYKDLSLIILRLWYFVVNMYVLFEIVFDYYCFEGHGEGETIYSFPAIFEVPLYLIIDRT
jgi:hypothetical protein